MSRRIIIACLAILTTVVLYFLLRPLFLVGFPQTDDGTWMVIRLTAFYQALADGQFPVRFLGRLNNHFGYPVANFLYPGFLYIGSFLHGIGIPFTVSVKAIMVGSILLGAGATFFWLRSFFSISASFVGMLMFITNPYILYDLYVRGSVGELLAIAMAQVTIFLIERNIRILIPLSFALFLISHNTLAAFFVPLIIFYVYYRRKTHLIIPLFIGGLLSVFFWVPALFEKSFIFFDSVTVSDPASYAGVTLRLLLESVPFLALSLFVLLKSSYIRHFTIYLFIILFLLVMLVTPIGAVVWGTNIFHQFIQFPFRLLAFFPFFGAFFTAYASSYRKILIRRLSIAIALGLSLVFFFIRLENVSIKDIPESMYVTNEATTTVRDEYLPRWVKENPTKRASDRVQIIAGDAEINVITISTNYLDAIVTARSQSVFRLNTIYYPGWIAIVDGAKTLISYDNPQGLIEIPLSTGRHSVVVEFKESPFRLTADIISLAGFIMYSVFCIRILGERKKKKISITKK